MLCPKCQQEIPDESIVCPFCNGNVTDNAPQVEEEKPAKKAGLADKLGVTDWWMFILGLLVPLAGFIVWLVLRESEPGKAQSALRGLVARLILIVVIPIVCIIAYFVFALIISLFTIIYMGVMSSISYGVMM